LIIPANGRVVIVLSLRIYGFSSGRWKVGSWYLLYVELQPHCNVLVTVD
jgi:hypothetical protein